MIKLHNILFEQSYATANKLNVLFITDYPVETIGNYAKHLIASEKVNGEIKSYSKQSSEEMVSLLIHNISTKFDLVVIQVSGLYDKSGKTLLRNLVKAVEVTKRRKIPIIFISTPTTKFINTDRNLNYIDDAYNTINQYADVIELPEIDTDDYFIKNGSVLNKAGNMLIYDKLLKQLKTLDNDLEITTSDFEEPETGEDNVSANKAVGSAAAQTVSPGSMHEPTTWEAVMKFFIDKGLSIAGAAGIAGNIKIESNFNPSAVGDKGTSYGLAQWHLDRKTALFKFASQQGGVASDANIQMEYLWNTLKDSYGSLVSLLQTTTDARDAAYQFAQQYERPANISDARLDAAELYAKDYDPGTISNVVKGAWNSLTNIATDIGVGNTAVGAAAAAGAIALTSSDTLGFATGKVDSGKVVAGGTNGNWDGSMPRALRIAKIANQFAGKNIIISQKRSNVQTASGNTSDHWSGVPNSYAVDLAATGAAGDALLAHIMNAFGHPEYTGGKWFNVTKDGYRYQFGWRVTGHYDHIHVGVKKV
jgi:hypothetical protein